MRRSLAALAACLALAVSGCGSSEAAGRGVATTDGTLPSSVLVAPAGVAVEAAEDPVGLSLALSSRFFASAPVVALSSEEALAEASEFASAHSVPLLVLPADAADDALAPAVAEVTRLGAQVSVPFGLEVPEGIAAIAPASTQAGAFKWPEAVQATAWTAVTTNPDAVETLGLLAAPTGGAAAPLAADPRTASDAVQAAHGLAGTPVIAVGGGYGTVEDFTWRFETAASGVELPGGGQLIAAGQFYVALYGHPGTPSLGVLGEQDLPATLVRAQEHANWYQGLVPGPIVPTLEIITTVASGGAGADGNYSNETSAADLVPWIEAARDAGMYVVLDLQPGRTDFLTQAQLYQDLLAYPNVGLALDPEWRLGPDQVHLRQIGSVSAAEVNTVATWLADFTRENRLPQKMFILHSFTTRMVSEVETLDVSRPELAFVMHVDGQGGQGAKQGTWNSLRQYASVIPHWGWKNFYDEDVPAMLTPAETIGLVAPTPLLVTYQ